jgi:penicillin-binding protein 1A
VATDLPLDPPAQTSWTRAKKPTARPPRTRLRRYGMPLLIATVAGAIAGVGFAAAIHVPRVEGLAEFSPGLITELRDHTGQPFADYARQRRVMLAPGDVPPLLRDAIIAAEDSNFYSHGGVDAFGVLRAVISNLRYGRRWGASTITMQLARKLYLNPTKKWRRKIEEAFLAVELEKQLSKEQILTLYCNINFLGHGNYGMQAAALSYFNKDVGALTLPEAATLAGIVQVPSRYSPHHAVELTQRRRDYVLRRMLEERFISREDHDRAVATPLLVAKRERQRETGPFFAEEVRRELEATYGTAGLYEKGLLVETTLDLAIQRATEDSLRQGLLRIDHRKGFRGATRRLEVDDLEAQELPSWADWTPVPGNWTEGIVLASEGENASIRIGDKTYVLARPGYRWTGRARASEFLRRGDVAWFRLAMPEDKDGNPRADAEPYLMLEQEPKLQGAAIVIESASGAVRALVGGWAFETTKFDRAMQAHRQVGSAFKPFVYGAALEAGFTPADTLFDAPAVFAGADARASYSPRNYYRKYYGIMTLRRGLELSANVTAVKLLDLVGVDRVIDFARRCGIQSALPPYPSLALGSADLVPMEVAAAYAAIANHGVYVEPYLIEKVASQEGRVLDAHQPRARRAMDPAVAYVLASMMSGVVDRGTAAALSSLDLDIAGKTGTTDDYSDAWFVGFLPRYTILTWIGYDQKRSIGRNMTGAEAALPPWKALVERGLEEGWLRAGERFAVPAGVTFASVEALSGLAAAPGAERVIQEAFVEGTEPTKPWTAQWATISALPWFQQRQFYIPREGERMPEDITDWALVSKGWEEKEEGR